MLSHRLRAAAAAALTIAGLTLPATALTAPAHAIPVRCATERAAVTEANQAATTARGNLADAKTALADAIAARRANPNPETRKTYTDALAARVAARGALNEAVQAVKDAIAARNACLNPIPVVANSYVKTTTEDETTRVTWTFTDATVTGLSPYRNYEFATVVNWPNFGGLMGDYFSQTYRTDEFGTLRLPYIADHDFPCAAPPIWVYFSIRDTNHNELARSRTYYNPCP